MDISIISYIFCSFFVLVVNGEVTAPKFKLNDGFHVPALALGTWLGPDATPKNNEVEIAVSWAIDAGYRHIDTAWRYGIEDQVGNAIANKIKEGVIKREDIFVTTKLWNEFHAKDAVVPALRESLKNLKLDYVDLYLIHWPVAQFKNLTYDSTDYVETWKGMIEAKNLGLTKSIGVSNFNQNQMNRIIAATNHTPAVLQVELNLNLQQPALRNYCKEKQITIMAYTPFGSLFPSKAAKDAPPPRIDDPTLLRIATTHNKTVTQINLRYLYELGVIPIPKSVTKTRIEENLNIFDFSLTKEEIKELESFDKNYRCLPQLKWVDNPYYPF